MVVIFNVDVMKILFHEEFGWEELELCWCVI